MADAIGTVIFIIIALVVIGIAGTIAFAVLGSLIGLIVLALKVAFFAGIIYLVWCGVRRFARTV
ncbi:MAG TPA: hypothetical protein VNQ79_06150 [Blastocatellia bacterium]|nr:hypothetical protein [Blastocatellia bacterium]